MPAAWRLDRYLDADVDDDEDISMVSLRGHRLKYDKSVMRDDMARNDNIDDLKVIPRCRRAPLLDVHSQLHVQTLLAEDYLLHVCWQCNLSQLGLFACFLAMGIPHWGGHGSGFCWWLKLSRSMAYAT